MGKYSIKEIYYTIQGEGAQTGRPAVFLRFSGCNLWSGREEDRDQAICKFCDTDFWGVDGVNGGKYTKAELTAKLMSIWPNMEMGRPYVVCTGGEPLLQLDESLINAFHQAGFEVGCETNGTINAPQSLDWICMSPKAGTEILVTSGNEIKIIYPQPGIDPIDFDQYAFDHYYLQPMDNERQKENIQATLQYCLKHPKWKLSLQTHKLLNIP